MVVCTPCETDRARQHSITTTRVENKVPESSGNALHKTSDTREEGRPAIHWTSAITLGDPVHGERDPVRTAFPRHRLKSDTSPLLSRDVVASIPTAKKLPIRVNSSVFAVCG